MQPTPTQLVIWKPSSLVELSVQVSEISLVDTAVAVKSVGAAGAEEGAVTAKFALVAVPPGVVTAMGPVVAPVGTAVLITVSVSIVKVADIPLKVTRLASVKPVPLTVTCVPSAPLAGVNELIVGGAEGTAAVVASAMLE